MLKFRRDDRLHPPLNLKNNSPQQNCKFCRGQKKKTKLCQSAKKSFTGLSCDVGYQVAKRARWRNSRLTLRSQASQLDT